MKVVRVLKPQAFQLQPIRALIRSALGTVAKNPERSIDKLAWEIGQGNPRLAFFVGLEGGLPKAFVLVALPVDPLTDWPMLDLTANSGSQKLGKATMRPALAFLRQAGYNEALVVNFSGRDDEIYIRAARRVGISLKKRATMMEASF